jgi:hypothetical protein
MKSFLSGTLAFLMMVGLVAGCSGDAKDDKPSAKTVPPYSAPKAAPITPAKSGDKAPEKKVGFQ